MLISNYIIDSFPLVTTNTLEVFLDTNFEYHKLETPKKEKEKVEQECKMHYNQLGTSYMHVFILMCRLLWSPRGGVKFIELSGIFSVTTMPQFGVAGWQVRLTNSGVGQLVTVSSKGRPNACQLATCTTYLAAIL